MSSIFSLIFFGYRCNTFATNHEFTVILFSGALEVVLFGRRFVRVIETATAKMAVSPVRVVAVIRSVLLVYFAENLVTLSASRTLGTHNEVAGTLARAKSTCPNLKALLAA